MHVAQQVPLRVSPACLRMLWPHAQHGLVHARHAVTHRVSILHTRRPIGTDHRTVLHLFPHDTHMRTHVLAVGAVAGSKARAQLGWMQDGKVGGIHASGIASPSACTCSLKVRNLSPSPLGDAVAVWQASAATTARDSAQVLNNNNAVLKMRVRAGKASVSGKHEGDR